MQEITQQLLQEEFLKGVGEFLIGHHVPDFGLEKEDFIHDCLIIFYESLNRNSSDRVKDAEGKEVDNVPGFGFITAKNLWKQLLEKGKPIEIPLTTEIEKIPEAVKVESVKLEDDEIDKLIEKYEEKNNLELDFEAREELRKHYREQLFFGPLRSKAFNEAIVQHQQLFSPEYDYWGVVEWMRRNPIVEKVRNSKGKIKINEQSLLLRLLWKHIKSTDEFKLITTLFEGHTIKFPSLEETSEARFQATLWDKKQLEKNRKQYYFLQKKIQTPQGEVIETLNENEAKRLYSINRKRNVEIIKEILDEEKVLREEAGKKKPTDQQMLERMKYLLKKEKKHRKRMAKLEQLKQESKKAFYKKTGITVLAAQFFRRLDLFRRHSYKDKFR